MIGLVTVEQLKLWCRIDEAAEDSILELLLGAAEEAASLYTGVNLTLDAPPSVRQAIAVHAADHYVNREGQTVGMDAFHRLLNPHRLVGL